jgi:hypothetical protein
MMEKCRGCEAFPKCTAETYGNVTCRYLRFSYGMDDRTEMTNADHIRSMTDEELAEVWVEPHCDRRTTPECKSFHGDCIACALDWLKQPYKEDT